MANTLKFGNGEWYGKKDTILAYNDENSNYKPLPFNFSRASKATVINKDGLIEEVGSGQPRVDYKDDSKGALKLEPSRSNLITYSEAISNTIVKRGNYADNFAISPDGTQNATKLTATNTDPYFYQDLSFSAASYTASIYVKGIGNSIGKNFQIRLANNIYTDAIPSEWTRFEYTVTTPSGTASVGLEIPNPAVIGDEVLVWGWQLEQGSYATSYIPTSGSAVTRVADTASGAGNSEVFNDSEGVLFFNLNTLDTSSVPVFSLSDGTFSNEIEFAYYGTNQWNVISRVGGANTSVVGTVNGDAYSKFSVSYTSSNFKVFLNGFLIGSNTMASAFSGLKKINFSYPDEANPFQGKTKEIGYYDEILTDLELETLTSYRSLNELVTELNLNEL